MKVPLHCSVAAAEISRGTEKHRKQKGKVECDASPTLLDQEFPNCSTPRPPQSSLSNWSGTPFTKLTMLEKNKLLELYFDLSSFFKTYLYDIDLAKSSYNQHVYL